MNHVGKYFSRIIQYCLHQEIDFDNPKFFLYGKHVKPAALELGVWSENTPLDFAGIYSRGEINNEMYQYMTDCLPYLKKYSGFDEHEEKKKVFDPVFNTYKVEGIKRKEIYKFYGIIQF